MCRANPLCDEDQIEVNTTIWFNADDNGNDLDLRGLDDVGFELVCPTCNQEITDDDLHATVKAQIEKFAESNDAAFAHSPTPEYESVRMRKTFDEIAKRFQEDKTRAEFEAIVAQFGVTQPAAPENEKEGS